MNVFLKNIDAVSAILKVQIEKSDYAEQWEKNLRGLRQKAVLPGFRKGMVPLGLVKKMYGKQTLLEEINKIMQESINNYLTDNQVSYLGNLLQNETEQKKIDYDIDENFEFCFDIALMPQFDVQLSKDDVIASYRVVISDEDVETRIEEMRKSFGMSEDAEKVEADDIVKGELVELEAGAPKQDGIHVEEAMLMPSFLKGKMEQKKFLNAKAGAKVVFNPYKAYKGAEAEIAAFLKIEKEDVKAMKSDFSFEIKTISRFKPAELNQEFFDRVLGKDVATNETELREKVKEALSKQYASMVEYRLTTEMKEFLLQKAKDVTFAEDFLKRWMLATDEKMTQEKLDEEFPEHIRDLKYNLVTDKLAKVYELKVSREELEAMAQYVIRMQSAQYGIYSIADEDLKSYMKEMLSNQETVRNLNARVLNEKIILLLKDKITITEEEVTAEAYKKIMKENN